MLTYSRTINCSYDWFWKINKNVEKVFVFNLNRSLDTPGGGGTREYFCQAATRAEIRICPRVYHNLQHTGTTLVTSNHTIVITIDNIPSCRDLSQLWQIDFAFDPSVTYPRR